MKKKYVMLDFERDGATIVICYKTTKWYLFETSFFKE